MPFISTLPAIKTYSAVVVNTPSFFFSVITLVGWRDRIVCTNSALRLNYQQVHETISFIFWFNLFFLVGRLHFLFFSFLRYFICRSFSIRSEFVLVDTSTRMLYWIEDIFLRLFYYIFQRMERWLAESRFWTLAGPNRTFIISHSR